MASSLKNLQGRAITAGKFVSTHVSSFYKQVLERNKQYIVEDANLDKCQELSKQFFYTNLASIPKRYESALKEVELLKSKIAQRSELSMEEVGIGAIFAAELYAWFCVGEIAGRGFTLTGYKV